MKNDSAINTASVLQATRTRRLTRAGNVSIKDVAARAQVAPSTVSAALSGNGRISDTLRDKVSKIAAEMNYRPRMAAQLLRANNTGYIGLLFVAEARDEQSNATTSSFGHAGWYTTHFLNVCQAEGLRSQIEFVLDDGRPNSGVSQLVHGGMLDGAIVVGMTNPNCKLARQLRDENTIPWVTFDEPADHCVLSATDLGIEQAVQHLAALGHRKIAMTRGDKNCEIHAEIQRGFDLATSRFGIDCRPQWTAEFKDAIGDNKLKQVQWLKALLQNPERPTAIICGGAITAGLVLHLATEMGIHVPRDLSLIAVGYSQLASVLYPKPVMIEMDFASMMRGALDNLRSRLAGRMVNDPTLRVLPCLTEGDTIALAPNQ
jgi:LacI family transcriptional regulator